MALVAATAGATSPFLTAEDARRLDRGETVVHDRAVAGWPWPEITAYRRSAASPTSVMAVYADFAAQASYIPGLVQSRVVGRDAPNVARVFYEYKVTGPNERYTVVVTVARDGDGWQARWTLLNARYARRLEGALHVVPHGEGSLLINTSLVDPGTLGVVFGTPATVATRLVQSTEALTARAEQLRTAEPERLATLVEALTTTGAR